MRASFLRTPYSYGGGFHDAKFVNLNMFSVREIRFILVIYLIFEFLAESASTAEVKKGTVRNETIDPNQVQAINQIFIRAAEAVKPSVVSITSYKPIRENNNITAVNPFDTSLGENLFRQSFSFPQGSGIIVHRDGYILTSNHLVADSDNIKVILSDKREFKAKVVGTDPKTDLAVLKIESRNLPVAKLGNSDLLEVGELVLAVGSPFGLDQTVTLGIISAKGRSNVNIAEYEDFIQTDAAVNPGNSGGPLVNLMGKVVGINTAIETQSGGYQGIGFAIPISMAQEVMNELIAKGKVVRGWLGVLTQSIDANIARKLNLKDTKGALVSDVVADSPASKSGIQRGDVILKYDGKPIDDTEALRDLISNTKVGEQVLIKLWRNGVYLDIKVRITEQYSELPMNPAPVSDTWIGMQVQEISMDALKFGYPELKGVVVTSVIPGSPAHLAGIVEGDLIKEIDKQPVSNLNDYKRITAKIRKAEGVLLLIRRDQYTQYVYVDIK